jgi:hypothetical protein
MGGLIKQKRQRWIKILPEIQLFDKFGYFVNPPDG